MDNQAQALVEGTESWHSELKRFLILAILGTVASYVNVNIPYTDVYIEGRWIFGTIGFALLHHWWAALFLACILSAIPMGDQTLISIFLGNMLYALPSLLLVRVIHTRVLDRLHSPVQYGIAWLLMLLLGYQLFTPVVWVFIAFLDGTPILPAIFASWREQPFLVESLLVGIISALSMIVVRGYLALRASEQELEVTLYSIGDGVITTDTAGHVRRMNPMAEKLTGWREAEALSEDLETVFRIFHEENQIRIKNPVEQVRIAKDRVEMKDYMRLIARDGTERFIVDSAAPIRDEDSPISGVVLIFRDQSEQRAIQKALEESHERLLLALHNAHMGIWDWDVNTHRVVWHGEHATLFGIPIEAFDGTIDDVQERVHPEDRERGMDVFQHTLETGADFDNTYRVVWPDGSIRWMHSYGKLAYDEADAPQRIVGTTQDITERMKAEEARMHLTIQMREQTQRMMQVLATVPAGVLLLDREGHILQANPTAEQFLTFLAETTDGTSTPSVTHLGDCSLAELLTAPATEGLWHEVKMAKRVFEAIARAVEHVPEPEHWVLVLREVTKEREVERHIQQQERLAAVGQLAAGIAHDFNNIMAVIVLYTQMALKAPDIQGKTHERLEIVSQQAKQATALIQQILDFSRQSVLKRQPLDLTPFLKEIIKLLVRTVPENIHIILTYGADEYVVNVDPTRIQQVILNLALNARDAMPQGGELHITLSRVTITEEARCKMCNDIICGEWVRITVADTGSGIQPEVRSHIFEPFFTTKDRGKGTGLGLSQVLGIIKTHAGHIEVNTQIDEGTTFTMYLPALLTGERTVPASDAHVLVPGRGETILVVEDQAAVRRALVDSLISLNYHVLEAENGHEALDILDQLSEGPSPPDSQLALVLSDLVMPNMGGQALFHAINARGLQIPVVILSGHPMENELDRLQDEGLAGWMLKPPNFEQLSQLLAQTIQQWSREDKT